jgi:hypothetical protein
MRTSRWCGRVGHLPSSRVRFVLKQPTRVHHTRATPKPLARCPKTQIPFAPHAREPLTLPCSPLTHFSALSICGLIIIKSGYYSSPLRTLHALRHNGDGQNTPTPRENSPRPSPLPQRAVQARPASKLNRQTTMLQARLTLDFSPSTPHSSLPSQSPTRPIRITRNSQKTNSRAPTPSPTFSHFANHDSRHF